MSSTNVTKIKRSASQRMPIVEAVSRMDSFVNGQTGFGTVNDNMRNTSFIKSARMVQAELEDFYDFNWMAKRAVELPVWLMTSKWPEFVKSQDEDLEGKDNEKEIERAEELIHEFNIPQQLELGFYQARAHWGAALWFDYGDDPETPLENPDPNKLLRIELVNNWYCIPMTFYRPEVHGTNFPKLGKPEHYQVVIQNTGYQETKYVHESRMVIIQGLPASSRRVSTRRREWGFSIIEAMEDTLSGCGSGVQAISDVLQEFFYITLQIENLDEHLLNKRDGDANVYKRAQAAVSKIGSQNVGIFGPNETLNRTAATVTGMQELVEKLEVHTAAAAHPGIPHSIFFSALGGALGGTSSGNDISNFIDRIVSMQNKWFRPVYDKTLFLLGFDTKDIPYIFPKIEEPTLMQLLEARERQSIIDERYENMGALRREEIRTSRFSRDKFDHESYELNDDLADAIYKEEEIDMFEGEPVPDEENKGDVLPDNNDSVTE